MAILEYRYIALLTLQHRYLWGTMYRLKHTLSLKSRTRELYLSGTSHACTLSGSGVSKAFQAGIRVRCICTVVSLMS